MWKEDTNSIICLRTPDQKELLKLYDKLKDETNSVLFFEPDIDEYTSMCVYGSHAIRKKLSKLPLLLKNREENVAI